MKNAFALSLFLMLACLVACQAAPAAPPANQARAQTPGALLSDVEQAIVDELNLARQHPDQYARLLEETRQYYDGKLYRRPGEMPVRTKEGVKAVDEAIRYLRGQQPLSPLRPSPGMSRAARDQLDFLLARKPLRLTHTGQGGSRVADRVNHYGQWQITVGENIGLGPHDARGMVEAFIIDDAVKDRSHRKDIFNPAFHVVGVANKPVNAAQSICVTTFAGEYQEKTIEGQAP